jgi:hypothetical protein
VTDIVLVWLPQRAFGVDGGLTSKGIVAGKRREWGDGGMLSVGDEESIFHRGSRPVYVALAANNYLVGNVQCGVGRKEDHDEDYSTV